jgi:putative Mn2+ efflux pump MntP
LPFIIWSLKKEESDFITEHGKNVLNFEITTMLLVIAITVSLGFIGFSYSLLFVEVSPYNYANWWSIFVNGNTFNQFGYHAARSYKSISRERVFYNNIVLGFLNNVKCCDFTISVAQAASYYQHGDYYTKEAQET